MSTIRVLPHADRDSQPWWDALVRHEFVNQRCTACGTWRWPPRAMCGVCSSFGVSWEAMSGRGVIASWIVTHHRFGSAQPGQEVVVLVRPVEQLDIAMPGMWSSEASPSTGMAVTLKFEDVSDPSGRLGTLLGWQPA